MVRRSMGEAGAILQGSVIDTGFGTSADCNTWSGYLLNSGCWKYSPAAWEEIAAFATPPAPPAVRSPGDIIAPPASGTDAQQSVDALLARQMRDAQTQNQAFFNAQPYVPESEATTTWLLIGAAGIVALALLRSSR